MYNAEEIMSVVGKLDELTDLTVYAQIGFGVGQIMIEDVCVWSSEEDGRGKLNVGCCVHSFHTQANAQLKKAEKLVKSVLEENAQSEEKEHE